MADPITMAMVGAAVGGGGSLLSGKSLGKSLKNAALGATLGYGGGTLLGAGGAGAAGSASGAASGAGGLSQGASGLLGVAPTASTTASLAVPTIAEGAVAGNMMIPYSTEIGMANSFNALTGAPMATTASSVAPAMFNNAVGAGGMSALNSGVAAPATFDTMFGSLKDLATPNNLRGAQMVADRFQQQPMQAAPAGRIEVGQAPSPEGLAQFMQQYYPQYKRPRSDLGIG